MSTYLVDNLLTDPLELTVSKNEISIRNKDSGQKIMFAPKEWDKLKARMDAQIYNFDRLSNG